MLRMHDFGRVQAVIFIIACNIDSAERAAFYFIDELITTLDSCAKHINLHNKLLKKGAKLPFISFNVEEYLFKHFDILLYIMQEFLYIIAGRGVSILPNEP